MPTRTETTEEVPRGRRRLRRTLLDALEALRTTREELRGSELERRRLVRENIKLTSALKKTIDLGFESDVVKGGLGGRTAVETYRNRNLGPFMHHMNELGVVAATFGHDRARLYLETMISADFKVLFAAPPATEEEGVRRSTAEWMISDPAAAERLLGTEESNERARTRLINLVLRSGVDTSTYELIRRSAEMLADKRGPRPDDE
jgi:hypothetical protein